MAEKRHTALRDAILYNLLARIPSPTIKIPIDPDAGTTDFGTTDFGTTDFDKRTIILTPDEWHTLLRNAATIAADTIWQAKGSVRAIHEQLTQDEPGS